MSRLPSGTLTAVDNPSDVFESDAARNVSLGFFTFIVAGTFNSNTVELQYSPDGNIWLTDNSLKITQNGAINVAVRARFYRAVATGGTDPNLEWWVF